MASRLIEARRYPWEPVDSYLKSHYDLSGAGGTKGSTSYHGGKWDASWRKAEPMPCHSIPVLLHLPPMKYYRWRQSDLNDRQADIIATNLGLHPALLWPDWFAKA